MNLPTLSQIIIAAVTVLISGIGVILSRRGKKADEDQVAISNQFKRYEDEVTYLTTQLRDTRAEWEARWSRQMDRCRKVLDQASVTIMNLATNASRADKKAADAERQHIQNHLDSDH